MKEEEPTPKWWLLSVTNWVVMGVFVTTTLYHVRHADQRRDAGSLVPMMVVWSCCMAYFFGFFGISFVDTDEDLLFVPEGPRQGLVSHQLSTIREEPSIDTTAQTRSTSSKSWPKCSAIAPVKKRQKKVLEPCRDEVLIRLDGRDVAAPPQAECLSASARVLALSGGARTTRVSCTTPQTSGTRQATACLVAPTGVAASMAARGVDGSSVVGRRVYLTEPDSTPTRIRQKARAFAASAPQSKLKLVAIFVNDHPADVTVLAEAAIPGPVLKRCLGASVSDLVAAHKALLDAPEASTFHTFFDQLALQLELPLTPRQQKLTLDLVAGGRDLYAAVSLTLPASLLDLADAKLARSPSSHPLTHLHMTPPRLESSLAALYLAHRIQHLATLFANIHPHPDDDFL